jgi:hypothetical protein
MVNAGGGGAVVAIAAAARARRLQEIVDAFRLAGATTPARAASCAAMGIDASQSELRELVREGVILQVAGSDRLYLDESAYIRHRESRRDRVRLLLLTVVLIVAAVAGLGLFVNFNGR